MFSNETDHQYIFKGVIVLVVLAMVFAMYAPWMLSRAQERATAEANKMYVQEEATVPAATASSGTASAGVAADTPSSSSLPPLDGESNKGVAPDGTSSGTSEAAAQVEDEYLQTTELKLTDETTVTLPVLKGAPVVFDKKTHSYTTTKDNITLVYTLHEFETDTDPIQLITTAFDELTQKVLTAGKCSDLISSPIQTINGTYLKTMSYVKDETVVENLMSILRFSEKYYGTVLLAGTYPNVPDSDMTPEIQKQFERFHHIRAALFGAPASQETPAEPKP